MEKVLKEKLALHAERMGIPSWDQHGFQWDQSTASNLLQHHDCIVQALENGEAVDCIYIDLSRAFDCISQTGY